jgi:hypothetical protein
LTLVRRAVISASPFRHPAGGIASIPTVQLTTARGRFRQHPIIWPGASGATSRSWRGTQSSNPSPSSGESVANHHPLPPTGQGRRGTRFVNEKPLVGLNRWPPDMPEIRAATTAYYAAMEAMTTRLVPIVAMALDLPPDYFAQAFAELNCTIRLIQRFGSSRLGPGSNHSWRPLRAPSGAYSRGDRSPARATCCPDWPTGHWSATRCFPLKATLFGRPFDG